MEASKLNLVQLQRNDQCYMFAMMNSYIMKILAIPDFKKRFL
jgi:hypothetical protein